MAQQKFVDRLFEYDTKRESRKSKRRSVKRGSDSEIAGDLKAGEEDGGSMSEGEDAYGLLAMYKAPVEEKKKKKKRMKFKRSRSGKNIPKTLDIGPGAMVDAQAVYYAPEVEKALLDGGMCSKTFSIYIYIYVEREREREREIEHLF